MAFVRCFLVGHWATLKNMLRTAPVRTTAGVILSSSLLIPISFLRSLPDLNCSSRSHCSSPDPNSNLWILVFPAGSGSEWPLLDLHRKLPIKVFPAGPELPTASSRSECYLRDFNHKESPKIYQIERMLKDMPGKYARKNVRRYARQICEKECHKIWHILGCFLVDVAWQLRGL